MVRLLYTLGSKHLLSTPWHIFRLKNRQQSSLQLFCTLTHVRDMSLVYRRNVSSTRHRKLLVGRFTLLAAPYFGDFP